jgi:TfoX/Sxy family transcriptional regulator of competence genes
MKIPKPTEGDRERFAALVPEAAQVEVKPMFGNLGAFVNGNMFMGLFGADVGIKLPEDDRQRLLAEPGAGPFGPKERPLAGYVTIPATWPADNARDWIGRSLAYVAGLPLKSPGRPRNHAAKPAMPRHLAWP